MCVCNTRQLFGLKWLSNSRKKKILRTELSSGSSSNGQYNNCTVLVALKKVAHTLFKSNNIRPGLLSSRAWWAQLATAPVRGCFSQASLTRVYLHWTYLTGSARARRSKSRVIRLLFGASITIVPWQTSDFQTTIRFSHTIHICIWYTFVTLNTPSTSR
jgi:hypothetical protein